MISLATFLQIETEIRPRFSTLVGLQTKNSKTKVLYSHVGIWFLKKIAFQVAVHLVSHFDLHSRKSRSKPSLSFIFCRLFITRDAPLRLEVLALCRTNFHNLNLLFSPLDIILRDIYTQRHIYINISIYIYM